MEGVRRDISQAPCPVCGLTLGRRWKPVLPESLITEWALSPPEAEIVDRREGESCSICGCSMRSQALAAAITQWAGTEMSLREWASSGPSTRLLEINTAGNLSPWLSTMPGHRLVEHPDIDMQHISFGDGGWDLVVHSDTLEHVADPIQGLAECRRLLERNGALCFTIPIIPGRLTKRRDGLPPSYHGGGPGGASLVFTEYGADFWTQVLDAGFANLTIVSAFWPEAVAFIARP
jgi:SAM-dependent methyltransferase